ncbi:metal-dependent hydrolase [Photobacterium sp. Alg240-V54]|uniref:metal-dependent hydrolase n=1 Tax=Photobacterium sp. Alg240-V54 TaxID=2305995 RepID=UPI0013D2FDA0|nr:metal-dependent hydrolase [Photobacterium sp. Alg240-V54]
MANFSTHFTVAAIVSGLTATTLLSADHISPSIALWMTFFGTIGGLLPDIDSDHSTSMKALFTLLAGFCCFILVSHIYTQVAMLELILYVVSLFITIRYFGKTVFDRCTVHRGACHSIAFVTLIALCCVHICVLLGHTATDSWLAGGFVLLGGIVHLALDEIYSVDLSNKRLKSSFGTALKPFAFTKPFISLAQVIAIVILFNIAPSYDGALHVITNWSHFQFTPVWFNIEDTKQWLLHMFYITPRDLHAFYQRF